jgi:hypothetical protein
MSSHHFVREGQEPALLIFDPPGLSSVEPLLEWAPLIVVTKPALEMVLSWGIKIDAVVGKNVDQLKTVLAHQTPVRLIEAEKDDLSTSLKFLIGLRQFNVCISCHKPEALIPLINNFHSQMEISILSASTKWSYIRSKKYSKWLVKNVQLNLFGSEAFEVNGKPITDNSILTPDDGQFEISAIGPFWVSEPL